ncbi:MAG: sarcosine oxidase subunit gamma family protein, partial [Planctomycetaceae bacterium]
MTTSITPIARTPLVNLHRRAGAKLAVANGWELATAYPQDEQSAQNRIADITGRVVTEFTGNKIAQTLASLCGRDMAIREIVETDGHTIYRLTDSRGLAFGKTVLSSGVDVTGGWTSLAVWGSDVLTLLNKVTAVDLRERTMPVGWCCQGPVFGVNTLFSRFANRIELHVCPDMLEFLWEVLLDAGAEFKLQPTGLDAYQKYLNSASTSSLSPSPSGCTLRESFEKEG